MWGTNWRGYYPLPALGRDAAGGVATEETWRVHGKRACEHGRAAVRAAAHVTAQARAHDMGVVRTTGLPWPQVATSIFVLRHG